MSRYFNSLILSLLFIFSSPAATQDCIAWMEYGDNDLRAAQILIDDPNPLIGVALYHIEQSVEKALKAYLIAQNISFALTHDLGPLLKSCCNIDEDFSQFTADAKEISPYATKSRYPNKSYTSPTIKAVEQMIKQARQILEFVRERI